MSDDAHAHDHAHEGHHSASHYKKIYFILVGLAFLSFLGPEVGGALDMKWLTLLTAFGIAFVKAWLVIKHFMHLDVEKPIVHYFLITTLAFMVLFFSAVSPDVMNHEGTNWVNVAAKAEIARALAAAEEEGHHGGHHGGGDHGGGHDADDHHHEGGDGHGDDGHHEGDDPHEGDDHHDEGDGH